MAAGDKGLCACPHHRCDNWADSGPDVSFLHAPAGKKLCLTCDSAAARGKVDPRYQACLCTCACRLPRAPGAFQCGDCLRQNRLSRRRHRLHFTPRVGTFGRGA